MDSAGMNGSNSCRRDVRPPIDAYSPSMWGDFFSTFSIDNQVQETYAEAIETLKGKVKIMLMAATSDKLITLINTLERLGLAYHFEKEIKEKVEEIYFVHTNGRDRDEDYDLFTTALEFRLLRQHQYNVSCNVFEKFVDENKKFKESISSDVEGLLSLYEASHVQLHGEDILEEAVVFTTHHLTRLVQQLESPLLDKVKQALKHPLHRSVQIIQARAYIPLYESDGSKDELILKLAKLNFNFLQNLYKKDLGELSRWWKKFDFKTTLPYVKDRLIESYIWGVAFHFEPQYSYVRKAVAISIQIITVVDDTFDNYATLEEAQLFTDIVERWNIDEIGHLPDYMKLVHHFLMSIYEDYEGEAAKEDKLFAVPYFKEAVIDLCRAYNEEQIWVREKRIPPYEEYYANSQITSCVYIILMTLIPGMKSVTKETIDWVLSKPTAVASTAKMGRCLDNLSTHQRENKGGVLLTALDCYMKYFGLSKQETLSKWVKDFREGWKDLNSEWIARKSYSIHSDIVELLFNYARACDLTLGIGDGYTNPKNILGPHIATLFVDSLII